MTSSKPYLLRAIYEWLLDNGMTPYIMVDADLPEVSVPQQHVENGKIILNITPHSVGGLAMTNECVEFDARFSGISHHVYVPLYAITAIYAYENGRGMVFEPEAETNNGGDGASTPIDLAQRRKGKPNLKVVK